MAETEVEAKLPYVAIAALIRWGQEDLCNSSYRVVYVHLWYLQICRRVRGLTFLARHGVPTRTRIGVVQTT